MGRLARSHMQTTCQKSVVLQKLGWKETQSQYKLWEQGEPMKQKVWLGKRPTQWQLTGLAVLLRGTNGSGLEQWKKTQLHLKH